MHFQGALASLEIAHEELDALNPVHAAVVEWYRAREQPASAEQKLETQVRLMRAVRKYLNEEDQ